jgi:hypothetical protein
MVVVASNEGRDVSQDAMPRGLPKGYARIWRLLQDADRRVGSRHRLAKKLHVSTHTLQRILVDGDVPDTGASLSRRQLLSWVRTVTRIAWGLEEDPLELMEGIGIGLTESVRHAAESEMEKLEGSAAGGTGDAAPPVLRLASLLLGVLSEEDSASRGLARSIEAYLRHSSEYAPSLAGHADLSSSRFCRSCMASLSDPENRGKAEQYCRWCSDDQGRLLSREQAHEVMTDWFMSWQEGISRSEAGRRADLYMQAMPAWND